MTAIRPKLTDLANTTRRAYNGGLVRVGRRISDCFQTETRPVGIGTKIGNCVEALGSNVYFRPATAKAEIGVDMPRGSMLIQSDAGRKTVNIGLKAEHNNPQGVYAANFGLVAARGGNLNVSAYGAEGPDSSTNMALLGPINAGENTSNFGGIGQITQGGGSAAFLGAGRIKGSTNNRAVTVVGTTNLDDESRALTAIGSARASGNDSRAFTGLGRAKADKVACSMIGTASTGNKGVSMTGLGKAESREEGASASLVGFASSGDTGVSLVGSGISLSGSDGDAVTVAGVSFTDKNGRAHSALGPEYQGGVTGRRPLKQRLPSERDKPVNEFRKRVDDLRSV